MDSLKEQIKNYLFKIYPQEMSSGDIENFAKSRNFNGETGRKRCGDLVKSGLVKTRVEIITKQDGKCVEVAFHKAIKESDIKLEDMPEYRKWHEGMEQPTLV
jgi:hypothetical protein